MVSLQVVSFKLLLRKARPVLGEAVGEEPQVGRAELAFRPAGVDQDFGPVQAVGRFRDLAEKRFACFKVEHPQPGEILSQGRSLRYWTFVP